MTRTPPETIENASNSDRFDGSTGSTPATRARLQLTLTELSVEGSVKRVASTNN